VENLHILDDISTVTGTLLDKHPSVTPEQIMSFGSLKYEDLRAGQHGACLNQNLLGQCDNSSCTYIHEAAKPTVQRAKEAKEAAAKLGPSIEGFMKARAGRGMAASV
jgi:hypothetical protein